MPRMPSLARNMKLEGVTKQQQVAKDLEQWVKKLKCSGSSGLGIETFGDITVGIDPSPLDEDIVDYERIDDELMVRSKVEENENTKPEISKGSKEAFQPGLRNGKCTTRYTSKNVAEIKGEYTEGYLHGRARIVFKDENSIDGYFVKGVLHGFARYFDQRGRLTFIGNHKAGCPDGTCWETVHGGGCVVGRVDRGGRLTGGRIAYIYPDYQTALVGVFKDGVMEKGREAEISGYVEDEAGIKIPTFTEENEIVHVRNARQTGTFGQGEFYNNLLL